MHLSEEIILDHLSNIDITKGVKPDKIHQKFIKTCAYYLAKPLCLLYNKLLKSVIFPDQLKLSYVSPIYKSGDKNDVTNYRPISKQSLCSKNLESLIIQIIKADLEKSIIPEQHVFLLW